jgi:integrase/recombinase XerD
MKQYNQYLQSKQLSQATVRIYEKYTNHFINHITEENKQAPEVKYSDILAFIEHLRDEGKSTGRINIYLTAIRHYYEYLNIEINPAEGVILKGRNRNIPANLIEEKELQSLYENYPNTDYISKRNKVITGLFIYQAITREELEKLKPEHLLLSKAKIIVPPTNKNNQRTIPVNAIQISDITEYLQLIRPELMKQHNIKTDKLFFGTKGSTSIRGSLSYIYKTINRINPEIKDAKQIRMSVISNKLKTKNLRKVQYFAGHKWVSSTERYKLNNIEDLKKEINKYHPLR